MAYSYQTHTIVGSGVQTFNLTIGYVAREHITVYLDGVDTPFDWLTDTSIELDVTGGIELVIRRVTPKDDETDLVVDFEDAATITEPQLDLVMRQLIFIAQEAIDIAESAMQKTTDLSAWDAESLPISNVGAPMDNADAVRLIDLANAVFASGSLPPVTAADNDSLLLVAGGAWATSLPAAVRTALGLTALALTEPGDAEGEVPVLEAGGELPAGVAGNQIDISGNPSITGLVTTPFSGGVVVGSYTATAADVTVPQHVVLGPTDTTWVAVAAHHAKLDTIARYGVFTGSAWSDGVTAALSTYGGLTNGILLTNPTATPARFLAIFQAKLDYSQSIAAERQAHKLFGTTAFGGSTITSVGNSGAAVAGSTAIVQVGDTISRLTDNLVVTAVDATTITVSGTWSFAGTQTEFMVLPPANTRTPRIASCIAARIAGPTASQLDSSISPRTGFDVAATWSQISDLSAQGTGEYPILSIAGFTVGAGSSVDVGGVVANLNSSSGVGALFANYRKNPFHLYIIRLT